jgi:hypothetical protein
MTQTTVRRPWAVVGISLLLAAALLQAVMPAGRDGPRRQEPPVG